MKHSERINTFIEALETASDVPLILDEDHVEAIIEEDAEMNAALLSQIFLWKNGLGGESEKLEKIENVIIALDENKSKFESWLNDDEANGSMKAIEQFLNTIENMEKEVTLEVSRRRALEKIIEALDRRVELFVIDIYRHRAAGNSVDFVDHEEAKRRDAFLSIVKVSNELIKIQKDVGILLLDYDDNKRSKEVLAELGEEEGKNIFDVMKYHIVEIEKLYQYYSADLDETANSSSMLTLNAKEWHNMITQLLPENCDEDELKVAQLMNKSNQSNKEPAFYLKDDLIHAIFNMALHNTARESDQIEEENVDLNNEISSGQFSSAVLRLAGVLHPSVSLSIGTRKLLHELMTHARVDLNGHFQSQLSHGTVHHLWDQNSAELNEIFQHYCTRDDSKAKKSNTDSPKISNKKDGSSKNLPNIEEKSILEDAIMNKPIDKVQDEKVGVHNANLMSFRSFSQMLEETNNMKKLIPIKNLKEMFSNAMLGSADIGLSYNSFLQLIAAAAHFYLPSPYLSLATRCEEFLKDKLLPIRKNMEKNAIMRNKHSSRGGSSRKKRRGGNSLN